MTKFEELQAMHEQLMEQSKSPDNVPAFVEEVQQEIHNMCVAAEDISVPRERDQLRAILRFWASYVYDQTGTYPDTTLHPARTAPPAESPERHRTHPSLLRIVFTSGVVFMALLIVVYVTSQLLLTRPLFIAPPNATEEVTTANPSPLQPQINSSTLTSGPSPFDEKVWVVRLQLSATGGNGTYIFWVNGEHLPDASNNQFTVEGKSCDPEKPVVGVTSGGQATSLQLIIQSPLPGCQPPAQP